jgi:hypothetical protein
MPPKPVNERKRRACIAPASKLLIVSAKNLSRLLGGIAKVMPVDVLLSWPPIHVTSRASPALLPATLRLRTAKIVNTDANTLLRTAVLPDSGTRGSSTNIWMSACWCCRPDAVSLPMNAATRLHRLGSERALNDSVVYIRSPLIPSYRRCASTTSCPT